VGDGTRLEVEHNLRGEAVESTVVPDQHAPPPRAEGKHELAIRHLTFWREGVSIEDGELMRYNKSEHARILRGIHGGGSPLAILNALPEQPVEVRVTRLNEDSVEPSRRRLVEMEIDRVGLFRILRVVDRRRRGRGVSRYQRVINRHRVLELHQTHRLRWIRICLRSRYRCEWRMGLG
jgi:hypothetical protein